MKIKLTLRYCFTFLLLVIVLLELHEMVHITVGYLLCGCWGTRDFNVWQLCESCSSSDTLGWIATLSGPVFSFSMMYLGAYFLSTGNPFKRSLGFAFIFANIPFGRITNVMMGGGDEMVVARHFLTPFLSRSLIIVLTSGIILLIITPPLVKAYNIIRNKFAVLYVIGFLTLPLLFLLTYTLGLLNSLLSNGFLERPFVMGTPLFITMHTLVAAILLIITRHNLELQWKALPDHEIFM